MSFLDGTRGLDVARGLTALVAAAVLAAWWWRRRWCSSDGEIGIEVMGKPSASSIAEAKTAAEGMTPASPAPLSPSGLSGDGVSRWSISIFFGTSLT